MLEDEFNMHISDSSYLYLHQGPYCPSSVSLPLQSVPQAVGLPLSQIVSSILRSTECTAINQQKEIPGKVMVCVALSHKSYSIQAA